MNTTDSAVRITHKPTGRGGVDAGREVAAAEPRQGHARAARAPARARAGRAAGRAGGRPQGAGGHRRALGEDPHLQLPPGPRDRPPREAHEEQPHARPGRRARRVHRGARGRREAPAAGSGRARHGCGSRADDRARGARCRGARPHRGGLRHPAARRRGAAVADALGVGSRDAVSDPDPSSTRRPRRGSSERVRRRARREPVAYILGRKGFRHIELAVDRAC